MLVKGAREEESIALNCLPESRQQGYADTPEEASKLKKVTISDKLRKLQARCDNNRLVDAGGKDIRFYNLQYVCGGAPPPEEFVSQQTEEIAALEKKYNYFRLNRIQNCDFPISKSLSPREGRGLEWGCLCKDSTENRYIL